MSTLSKFLADIPKSRKLVFRLQKNAGFGADFTYRCLPARRFEPNHLGLLGIQRNDRFIHHISPTTYALGVESEASKEGWTHDSL